MTVWILKRGHARQSYHTRDCAIVDDLDNYREITKDAAERIGLDHCNQCQRPKQRDSQDWGHYNALREANND